MKITSNTLVGQSTCHVVEVKYDDERVAYFNVQSSWETDRVNVEVTAEILDTESDNFLVSEIDEMEKYLLGNVESIFKKE